MRIKLFLSFSLIVLITAGSIVLLAAITTGRDLRQFFQRGGFSGNDVLVENLEAHFVRNKKWDGAENIFRSTHFGTGPGPGPGRGPGAAERPPAMPQEQVLLADADGTVLIDTGQKPAHSYTLSNEEREQAIPLYAGTELVGYLLPETRVPFLPGVELALLSRLNRSALIAGGLAGLVALGLAFGLAYFLQRPIKDLTAAAAKMARGDLSQRVRPRGNDEVATLSHTFNLMADSLEQAESRRRAITADIAHELRNPLAVQLANLEALQDGVYPMTRENLDPVIEQTRLLERLVEDLRMLALADAGQLDIHRDETDMRSLLERKIGEWQLAGRPKQILFNLALPETCQQVQVDAGRIQQVLDNLANNAIRHTPEGGLVWVAMECTAGRVSISVRDSGPGIEPEDLPNIFDRFYRGDKSRSRQAGNTGLGLSIARRIAEAHGGKLEAANHDEGGAVFTLTLS